MDSQSTKAIKLFYCYARKDKRLREELEKHLSLLKRQGFISTWYDQEILPGEEWKQAIGTNLRVADIILLLVSPDFMHSDYCYSIEMQQALERHTRGEICIVPIILRHVDWKEAPFGHLQVLPTEGKPVVSQFWHNRDEAFASVVQGIRKAVEELRSKDSPWTFSETRLFASADVLRSLHHYQRHELLAVDDGVVLYPFSGFRQLDLKTITTVCDLRGTASIPVKLINPSRADLLQLHFEGSGKYSEKIDSYLQRKIEEKEIHKDTRPFTTKVGLTRIDYPFSREGHGLTLHVAPLSYWTVQKFNRQILGDPADRELQTLREESLREILLAKDEVTFPCPSALYIELSVVTNDGKLVILEKHKQLSVLARTGHRWTCTVEEGLGWERDIHNGQLDFYEAAKHGVSTELKIKPEEIETISFYGIALEHTHLNSALLGVMTLKISEQDLKRRMVEFADPGEFVIDTTRFINVNSVFQNFFGSSSENNATWHPTGRMRALLTLRSLDLYQLR